ncbi:MULTISPECIES: Maf family protein [Planktothricoides]|uniref:Nucleoside triphosphate pyrophosphatase n=2 Tax=Planktothricoides raciborskii TaxID=132608 RepID=A0AAU8JFF8_9CYAN|nr:MULTISPECIES: nucleoside triphosphate pyrophosphatase [Planktothricoides]KOR37709.1 septum formation protein Maf [Planktothricoides sp. SR001]MBD2544146.1 septum formation inhibitor Maf [Planktothricoides raciborskii FACHB-1370]MBD2582632.1 septum formation inhibitor Maf [Planktothricoides raciborskii FACHB-1261]
MKNPALILASTSPARLMLLKQAGFEPIVCRSNFDESQVQIDEPSELVETLARCKAEVVAQEFTPHDPNHSPMLVLGCDSVLVLDGEIHGKPETPEVAIARWQKMRSSVGELYTGHALIDLTKGNTLVRCQVTKVYFAPMSDRQIVSYVATGEPLNCAGCFAIDGQGGLFVEKLEGCHTNVIGLSLPLLRQMITDLGYDVTDFWLKK